jgi:hypothetical protein
MKSLLRRLFGRPSGRPGTPEEALRRVASGDGGNVRLVSVAGSPHRVALMREDAYDDLLRARGAARTADAPTLDPTAEPAPSPDAPVGDEEDRWAFETLEGAGVSRAEVHFSGGHDEGGPDGITLYGPEGAPLGEGDEAAVLSGPEGERLAEVLERHAEERYGGYTGDGIDGHVCWDVAARRVTESGSYLDWTGFEDVLAEVPFDDPGPPDEQEGAAG